MFVSTYNDDCGIATYTSYLLNNSKRESKFLVISESKKKNNQNGAIEYLNPGSTNYFNLGRSIGNFNEKGIMPVLWYQHTFGINDTKSMLSDMDYLASYDAEIIVTMHTLYFERFANMPEGTTSGMRKEEELFLEKLLKKSNVKALAVLTEGAYNAVTKRFPQYKNKITIIRHGVHDYSHIGNKADIRDIFFGYLRRNDISKENIAKLDELQEAIKRDKAWLIAGGGYPNKNKMGYIPVLRADLDYLVKRKVYAIVMGGIREEVAKIKDKGVFETVDLLEKRARTDERFIFINKLAPDPLFPYLLGAGDIFCGYEKGNTQSGRACHLLGIENAAIIAGDFEGGGETLRKIGFPLAGNQDELARVAAKIVLMGDEGKEQIEENKRSYLEQFSWIEQARKHLELVNWNGKGIIPQLDLQLEKIVEIANEKYVHLKRIS